MHKEQEPQPHTPQEEHSMTDDEKYDKAYQTITHIPEGIEINNRKLEALAREHNQTVCYPQAPEILESHWVVHLPNGETKKIAPLKDAEKPPTVYFVFYPNGTVNTSPGPAGIEAEHG
jgi:hypothetical protein